MPSKARKPCNSPYCPELTTERYCAKHAKEKQQLQDRQRGTAAARGYGHKWRQARLHFLQQHPLCKHCMDKGKLEPATVVDHIVPHKGDMTLFWDRGNWQSLCGACHSIKTAKEDGGVANTKSIISNL
ncbi:HNH endonuclease [Paenibacillus chitinolyticus]|uniref:HNH endonuclease n=1 Tax=Paenibacillus chitinolyticus TaxID=79263 RepID=UPI002DBDF569|nr:HNH endonuclease [Paenibacillus chitinolyticus]MEC0248902.1 HNH endonuclease [Paenibacillus chitinolyticus]